MPEPMALSAALNYFADCHIDIILKHFAALLFAPLSTSNLSPQERGNMMKLVIAIRFMQEWWSEPPFSKFRPIFTQIPKPRGVIDSCYAKDNQVNDFNL